MSNYGMSEIRSRSLCGAAMFVLLACGMGQATAEGATIYSQDPNLTDFTSTITTYGTFVSGTYQGLSGFATLTPSNPFTPTSGTFASANYPRVIGGSTNPVDVTFGTATNQIVVFDNIDHPGNA